MTSDAATLRHQVLWLPRRGHAREEYEDAFAADPVRGRYAIADGASESSFAARWAQLLVEEFVRSAAPQPGSWADWLPAPQERWAAELGERALPWYAETKFQQGAFAAFLGVVVEPGRWQAVAVGDCCLFQMRGPLLHHAFPLTFADDFDNTPWLVGSRAAATENLTAREVRAEGAWQAGDRLWLMTDALAQWFLRRTGYLGS